MNWSESMGSFTSNNARHASRGGASFDALLLTTCDAAGPRFEMFLRLAATVAAACRAGLRVHHYLLLQRADQFQGQLPPHTEGYVLQVLRTPQRHSLSRARNILLRRADTDGALGRAAWVAFPDDDAWYPDGLLHNVNAFFQAHSGVELLACRYGTDAQTVPATDFAALFQPAIPDRDFVLALSSNTLLLRASAVIATGYFDERLGLGAAIMGGEDLDYALRCFTRHPEAARQSSHILIGHRDGNDDCRARYYPGSLFALARSARHSRGLRRQMLRKLVVGAALVLRGELSLQGLAASVRHSWRGWCGDAPLVS
jgi:hypothetical protein